MVSRHDCCLLQLAEISVEGNHAEGVQAQAQAIALHGHVVLGHSLLRVEFPGLRVQQGVSVQAQLKAVAVDDHMVLGPSL